MIELTEDEAKEILAALQAAGIFHTPLMRRRLNDTWDEYHSDAGSRRQRAMEILASKGLS